MEPTTVHCPLGACHGAVRLRSGVGVYYVQGYHHNPETPVGYRTPDPAATAGGERFVDERRRRQLTIECTDGHYLRLHMAEAGVVDAEECLYGPVETDAVRCPSCRYTFGEWASFRLRTPGPTDRVHELQSVTATSPPAYSDVNALTRDALADHDRFSHRRTCPNCGTLVAFNYERP